MENDVAPVSLSPAQIELMSFNDIEVLREWPNIDVLAHSKTGGWCLLIENKIHSGEGKGQLVRYLDRVNRDFPDRRFPGPGSSVKADRRSKESIYPRAPSSRRRPVAPASPPVPIVAPNNRRNTVKRAVSYVGFRRRSGM